MIIFIQIIQVIAAILLIVAILLQAQGGGMSAVFGGGGEQYRSKRSVEKVLYFGTMVLAGLLGVTSLALLLLNA